MGVVREKLVQHQVAANYLATASTLSEAQIRFMEDQIKAEVEKAKEGRYNAGFKSAVVIQVAAVCIAMVVFGAGLWSLSTAPPDVEVVVKQIVHPELPPLTTFENWRLVEKNQAGELSRLDFNDHTCMKYVETGRAASISCYQNP